MVDMLTSPRSLSCTHEPAPTSAPRVRRQVRAALTGWGVEETCVEDALLVVEELVANAVDHAHTRFHVDVRLSGSGLHIAVRDRSDLSPHVRPFDPHAARGRGLQLVSNLAQRWGCEHHADGKTVWAELCVPVLAPSAGGRRSA